ncbi:MAG: hypothetical protein LBN99_03625 [Oscillospiraceae bacterium]|jgi:hypothetical protein|nr:hypothetical protein [Oscillospiraceae bacterium]
MVIGIIIGFAVIFAICALSDSAKKAYRRASPQTKKRVQNGALFTAAVVATPILAVKSLTKKI